MKGINIWVVPLLRYTGQVLKWTKKEFRKDKNDGEYAQGFTPRDVVDRHMYQEKKEEIIR